MLSGPGDFFGLILVITLMNSWKVGGADNPQLHRVLRYVPKEVVRSSGVSVKQGAEVFFPTIENVFAVSLDGIIISRF